MPDKVMVSEMLTLKIHWRAVMVSETFCFSTLQSGAFSTMKAIDNAARKATKEASGKMRRGR